MDEEIDDLVAKLAGELTLCGIVPNQKAIVDSLEAQMDDLTLKGEQQQEELLHKAVDGEKPGAVYNRVQKLLDERSKVAKDRCTELES